MEIEVFLPDEEELDAGQTKTTDTHGTSSRTTGTSCSWHQNIGLIRSPVPRLAFYVSGSYLVMALFLEENGNVPVWEFSHEGPKGRHYGLVCSERSRQHGRSNLLHMVLCLFLFAWASGCSECGILVFFSLSPNEAGLRSIFSAVEEVGTLSTFSTYSWCSTAELKKLQ